MSDWRSFWDSEHSIYVNARHKDVHYREIADQIAAFVPGPAARVLDYGSGDAIHADRVAAVAAEVTLCDAAPSVRAAMASRFAGNPRIKVISPEEVAALPDGRLDLIVTNSVAQYLTEDELTRLLAMFRRLLAPSGTLIFADVIPPDVGALSDVTALLRYGAKHGFLFAALVGLAKTAVSPYRKIRSTLGIAQYTRSAVHEEAHRRRLCRRAARAQHGAQSGAHDVPRAAGLTGYFALPRISSTRCFCAGVTLADDGLRILRASRGIEIFDDALRLLAVGDELRIVQRDLDRLLQIGEPRRRDAGRRDQDAAELLDIGEEIHHPGLLGIHLGRFENGRTVLEEARLVAGDRRQRPVLLGADKIVGRGFRHDRAHPSRRG